MPVLILSLQEEEAGVLGAARQLLAKFKISWHLYFFQHLKKVKSRGKGRQTFFEFFTGLKYSGASEVSHTYFPVVQFIRLQYSVLLQEEPNMTIIL